MANTVYFDPAVGGTGLTVTDDGNPTTGLDNDGHRVRFVPALAQVVAVARYVVNTAQDVNADKMESQQAVVDVQDYAQQVVTETQGYAQQAADSAADAKQVVLNGAAIVPMWVSGQSWAQGQLISSPLDDKIYRKITPNSESTIDPSLDGANWEIVNPDPVTPESFTLAQAQATALCF